MSGALALSRAGGSGAVREPAAAAPDAGIRHVPPRLIWTAGGLLLAGTVFLLGHLNSGLWHDARLYTFLALARLDPALNADIFIRYGGQDQFTLFTPLYAALIAGVGLTVASVGLLAAGLALWFGAAALFARRVVRGPGWPYALILAVAVPATYSSNDIFHTGEAFLSPRLFAEALAIAAMALAASRPRFAAALLALALPIHPLMTLPAIGVALLAGSRRWAAPLALIAAGSVAALGLALAGAAPFDRLIVPIDAEWRSVILMRTPGLFVGNWRIADWTNLAGSAAVVAAAAACAARGARRRLFAALPVVAGAGIAASWLLADRLHSVLAIQLQLWRASWPLHFAAPVALVWLALRLRRRPGGWAAVALLAPALAGPMEIGNVAAIFAGAAMAARLGTGASLPVRPWQTLACVALGGLLLAGEIFGITPAQLLGHAIDPFRAGPRILSWRLMLALICLPLLIAGRRWPSPMAGFALFLFIFAASIWDARRDWQRLVTEGPVDIGVAIPPRAQIQWGDEPALTWFLLRRPSYVSPTQGGAVSLSRGLAIAYRDRLPRVVAPGTPTTGDAMWRRSCALAELRVTPARLRAMCGPGGPAAVILDHAVPGMRATPFNLAGPMVTTCWTGDTARQVETRRFYYHDCAALR